MIRPALGRHVRLDPQEGLLEGELVFRQAEAPEREPYLVVEGVTPELRRAAQTLLHSDPGERDPAALLGPLWERLIWLAQEACLLRWLAVVERMPWIGLEHIWRTVSRPVPVVAERGAVVVSRYAFARCDQGRCIIETPLGTGRVVLYEPRAAALVAALSEPRSASMLTEAGLVPSVEAGRELIELLCWARVVGPAEGKLGCSLDTEGSKQYWEFQDLLFHSRSRSGRSGRRVGAKARPADQGEPPPCVKPVSAQRSRVTLQRPAEDSDSRGFVEILERRRCRRNHGANPITLQELGHFLYRAARIKSVVPSTLSQTDQGAHRPYPSGGARNELGFYIVANRCAGLDQAVFEYDPSAHALVQIAAWSQGVERLLKWAADAAGKSTRRSSLPQVLIVLAARMARVAWKYEGIAYALLLKNVGAAMATMCLVAEAMNLAACPIGNGNSDLFAQVSGLDYLEETSVGELMLGSNGSTPG